jgi:hypothetical protein
MAYGRLLPTDADTLVLVNSVAPVEVTLTSEKTLIESSPKIYKKLLAEYRAVMFPCSVSSVNVSEPALTDVKSNGLVEDE